MRINRKWLITIMTSLSLIMVTSIICFLLLSTKDTPTTTKPGIFNTLAGVFNSIIPGSGSEGEPFNVLILGGDKVARNTDTIMLANFNPKTGNLNIMSIPRDTLVSLNGWEAKINAAYPSGGANLAASAIKNLMDIDVKYYFFVDTKAFRDTIDLLGGVQYNIPVDMHYEDPTQDLYIDLKEGPQLLDGDKAEQFMRFRQPLRFTNEISKYYDGSDLKRISAQQDFMKELIKQKVTISNLPKLKALIEIVLKNTETNMPLEDAINLSKNLGSFSPDKISTFMLPGQPAMINEGSYYLIDYEKTIDILTENFTVVEGFKDSKKVTEKIISNKANTYNNATKSTSATVYENKEAPTEEVKVTNNPTDKKASTRKKSGLKRYMSPILTVAPTMPPKNEAVKAPNVSSETTPIKAESQKANSLAQP